MLYFYQRLVVLVSDMGSIQFQNWIFLKNELELRNFELENFELELKFPTKKLNPKINLPFLQC